MLQSVLHTTVSAALTIFPQRLFSITTIVMTCFNASHDEHHYVFNLSCNSSRSSTLSFFFLFSPCQIKILWVAMALLALKFFSRIVPFTSSCRLLDCLFRFGTIVYASASPAHVVPICTDLRSSALMSQNLRFLMTAPNSSTSTILHSNVIAVVVTDALKHHHCWKPYPEPGSCQCPPTTNSRSNCCTIVASPTGDNRRISSTSNRRACK